MKLTLLHSLLVILAVALFFGEAQGSTSAEDIWAQHVYDSGLDRDGKPVQIQKGCEPTHILPAEGTTPIGVAIFTHGYTGCPQQFFDLANILANAGYEVYLPLSPGQGWALDASGNEVLDGMPNLYEAYRYRDFVEMLNQLAAASNGLRMIGGLSGGGAIATAAMNSAKIPYDRAILIAPWLHARGTFLQNVAMIFERFLPLGFHQTVPWGASCLSSRSHGRAGYCQTYISNLACAENFGLDTYFSLVPAKTKAQFIGVEDDPAVDNDTNSRAIEKMQLEQSAVCFMPKGIPHSFFSRFDNDDDNPIWIPDFEKYFLAYAVDGTPFPQAGPSLVEGYQQCQITH